MAQLKASRLAETSGRLAFFAMVQLPCNTSEPISWGDYGTLNSPVRDPRWIDPVAQWVDVTIIKSTAEYWHIMCQ